MLTLKSTSFFAFANALFFAASALADPAISTSLESDRLLLCGKANVAALNARLANDPIDFYLQSSQTQNLQFDSALPTFFNGTYWGIRHDEAYVCLGGDHFTGVTWSLANYPRTGDFDRFGLSVEGFKTDATGQRIDVNLDSVVDDDDWTEMRYLEVFSGADATDSALINNAFTNTWGPRSVAGTVTLSNYEGGGTIGYPRDLSVTTATGPYFSAHFGQTDLHGCPNAWQNCVVWDHYIGGYSTVAPTPALAIRSSEFEHENNRWVDYRAKAPHEADGDTYTAHDPGLAALLQAIEFEPKFWVQAKSSSLNFLNP